MASILEGSPGRRFDCFTPGMEKKMNFLPLVLLGGAAAFLLTQKPQKTAKKSSGGEMGGLEVEMLLNNLGYPPGSIDGRMNNDTMTAIGAFQNDWNRMVEWFWKYNDKIDESHPKYQKIGVSGQWNPETETVAKRSISVFGSPGGTTIEFQGNEYPVANFREMVATSYSLAS